MRNREFVFTPKIEYKLVAESAERADKLREANLSNLQFPTWCVFTVWLELILSEIPERNQTKEASPPPLAGTRHPAKKFSSLFLICARRIFSSKRERKLFCLVLLSPSRAAGLASIFCKNTAEFPPHPSMREISTGNFLFPIECREAKRHYLP